MSITDKVIATQVRAALHALEELDRCPNDVLRCRACENSIQLARDLLEGLLLAHTTEIVVPHIGQKQLNALLNRDGG